VFVERAQIDVLDGAVCGGRCRGRAHPCWPIGAGLSDAGAGRADQPWQRSPWRHGRAPDHLGGKGGVRLYSAVSRAARRRKLLWQASLR